MSKTSLLTSIAKPLTEAETQARYMFHKHVKGAQIESAPTFIVGCGHSGTSLLLKILGSHSRIHAIHYETKLAFKSEEEQREQMALFEKWTVAAGKRRWVEKTPRHIRKMDILRDLCPEAYFLVIMRDGRDVACSLKARFGEFEKGVNRWVSDNKVAQEHWSHPNTFVLKYEDLIEDFTGTVTGLVQFIGEDFEEDMKEYYRERMKFQWRGNTSALFGRLAKNSDSKDHRERRVRQIHQPIFDGRGKWRNEMSEEEKELFKRVGGDVLIEYGYAADHGW